MRINYLIKEALRGFSYAKLSMIASIITISLSILLISIYLLFSYNSNKLIKNIKDKVEIEVFLNDNIKSEEITSVREKIKTIGGIKSITYISKEEAVKIFENEWGKGMLDILEYNPLPASYRINLYDEYKTLDRINKIKTQLSTISQINDIQFPEKNLELIESKSSGFLMVNFIIMIIITVSSVFLVSNTIRLIIHSRNKNIILFKLSGATKSFIMLPYLIEGVIQGIAGGIISIFILLLFYNFISSKLNTDIIKIDLMDTDMLIYLMLFAILLGIAGSYFSVKKYLKFQK